MFYPIAKAAWRLVEPDNLLLLIAVLGGAAAWLGRRRLGRGLLLAALALLAAVAIAPIGAAALARLEARFPEWRGEGPVDGVIVLGGGINASSYFAHRGSGLNGAAARIVEAARLARERPSARIIYSGGPLPSGEAARNEGRAAQDLFAALGVEPARVALELDSRDTYENAVFAKRLIQPKPGEHWLLVTSAFHMPRAVACFRAAGFPVDPVPVDYRYLGHERFGPGLAEGLTDLDLAVHEWAGLLAYRLSGRTQELLPAP